MTQAIDELQAERVTIESEKQIVLLNQPCVFFQNFIFERKTKFKTNKNNVLRTICEDHL